MLTVVLLSLLVAACDEDSSNSNDTNTATRELTAEVYIYDNAYSYLSVMIPGAKVRCNGQDTGVTNSDGYALLHYTVPETTTYFFADDCTASADGYYSKWVQLAFQTYPAKYSIGLSSSTGYGLIGQTPLDLSFTTVDWNFKIAATANVYDKDFENIPRAEVKFDFGNLGISTAVTDDYGYAEVEKIYFDSSACNGTFPVTAYVTTPDNTEIAPATIIGFFHPNEDLSYCETQLDFMVMVN